MLTGQRAFDGEDIVDMLGAVARLDPDWTAIPDATPPVIRRLVRRCLEKDRKRRMADISTAVFLIEELRELPVDSATTSGGLAPALEARAARARRRGVVAAIAGALAWAMKPSALPLVTRSRSVPAGGATVHN